MNPPDPLWRPEAQIRFRNGQGQSLSDRDMQLLASIGETRSIAAAAQRLGVSYKTAMRSIQKMNAVFSEPLVASLSGGSSGGQTELTALGREWLARYLSLTVEQRIQMLAMGRVMEKPDRLAVLEKRPTLKLSARNQWPGRIVEWNQVGQQVRLRLELQGGVDLWARITRLSAEEMGLDLGQEAIAVVKAKSVRRVKTLPTRSPENAWKVDWIWNVEANEWRATWQGGLSLVSTDSLPVLSGQAPSNESGMSDRKRPYATIAEDEVLIGMAW